MLAERLARQGVTLSATALTTALAHNAEAAAVPMPLVVATSKAAAALAAGQAAAVGVVSASVAALMEGVLQAMLLTKLKIAAVVLLTVGSLGTGAGVCTYHALATGPTTATSDAATGSSAQGTTELAVAENQEPGDKTPQTAGDSSPTAQAGSWEETFAARVERTGEIIFAISPVGKEVATVVEKNLVSLWDIDMAKSVLRLKWQVKLGENDGPVMTIRFSSDGKVLATGGDKTVKLWDAATGKELRMIQGLADAVRGVAFSPDGKFLATAGYNHTARLLDMATGQAVTTYEVPHSRFLAAAFAPDGKVLALGELNRLVRLWDTSTGRSMGALTEFPDRISALAFSPDGRLLATASGDAVKVWDLAKSKTVLDLRGHGFHATSVVFSPEGKRLASGSMHGPIRVWDVATGVGQDINKPKHGPLWESVSALGFSPDGKTLVSCSDEGTVRLWRLKSQAMTARAAPAKVGTVGDPLDQLVQELLKSNKTNEQMIEAICLATLARFPTEGEQKFMADHLTRQKDRREAIQDILWALLNTKEFSANVEAMQKRDPRRPTK
jgi:hypothetical protein